MFALTALFLGLLLGQVNAQGAAATTYGSAPTGICNDENGLLSCLPAPTACPPESIPASFSSCACKTLKSAINCYSSYCPAQLTEDELAVLSSDSSLVCNGVGTIYIPSGVLTTSVAAVQTTGKGGVATTSSGSGSVAITGSGTAIGTGTGEGATSSASVATTSSKGAAEGRMDNVVPVLGGVLGALVGVVGVFL